MVSSSSDKRGYRYKYIHTNSQNAYSQSTSNTPERIIQPTHNTVDNKYKQDVMNSNFNDPRTPKQREQDIAKIIYDCEQGRPEPGFDTAHGFNCYAADLPEALKRIEKKQAEMKKELARAKKADRRRGGMQMIIEDGEENIKRRSGELADNERKVRGARR